MARGAHVRAAPLLLVVAVGVCDVIAAAVIIWWNPTALFVAFGVAYVAALALVALGVTKRQLVIVVIGLIVTVFADTEPLGGVVANEMFNGRAGLGPVISLIAGLLSTAGVLALVFIEASRIMKRTE